MFVFKTPSPSSSSSSSSTSTSVSTTIAVFFLCAAALRATPWVISKLRPA
jgi:hypothetical protein